MRFLKNNLNWFFSPLLVLIVCCNGKTKNIVSIYDESQYEKLIIDTNSYGTNYQNNYEVYIFLPDTARKMMKYYWDNKQLQARSFFYHNQKDGQWEGYFDNGKLSFKGSFVRDKKNGIFTIYYPNGKISTIEIYKNGSKAGAWEYYDTFGNLVKKKNME